MLIWACVQRVGNSSRGITVSKQQEGCVCVTDIVGTQDGKGEGGGVILSFTCQQIFSSVLTAAPSCGCQSLTK